MELFTSDFSALDCFDGKSAAQVITAAGVSRGTFYNYFRTNTELLISANEELGNELATLIETHVRVLRSPAARIATGVRLYFDVAQRFPLFARFLARVGPQAARPNNILYTYLPIHIAEGIKTGEFVESSVFAAVDLIVGSGVLVVARISAGEADESYLYSCVLGIMRGLGYPRQKAEALMSRPLPPLTFDEQSLLMQSHKRYTEQRRGKRARSSKLRSLS